MPYLELLRRPAIWREYLSDTYQKILYFFRLLPGAWRIFPFLRQIIRRGAYEVRTPFPTREVHFRTLIQMDGDALHFFPHPNTPTDPTLRDAWLTDYEATHQSHQERLDNELLAIALSWDFWRALFSVPVFLGINYNLVTDLYTQGDLLWTQLQDPIENWQWLRSFGIAGLSFYFRRKIIDWVITNLFAILRVLDRIGKKFKIF
ncbi:MAG: hypothetical protein ACFCUI_11495 [Bernardetiaceae bacterium]